MDNNDYIDGIPIEQYRVNMTKIDPDKLRKLYQEQGKSISEIAKKFGCGYQTIRKRLLLLDIPIQKNKGGRPKKKKRFSLGKKELAELLENERLTIADIARKLHTTPELVRRYIEKYGL